GNGGPVGVNGSSKSGTGGFAFNGLDSVGVPRQGGGGGGGAGGVKFGVAGELANGYGGGGGGGGGWSESDTRGGAGASGIAVFVATNTCIPTLSPTTATSGWTGGSGSISVTVPNGCTWSASASASWLTITSGASGTNSGTVTYTNSLNGTGLSRTAAVIVSGQSASITQSASANPTVTWTGPTSGRQTAARAPPLVSQTPGVYELNVDRDLLFNLAGTAGGGGGAGGLVGGGAQGG